MLTHFPQAVPEIPVSNVEKAAEYYVNVLGFHFDWGDVPDQCTVLPILR
jgi:catechol 2,3-dioxygenase-like lactoylglutathione lyase family enzyme